MWRQYGPISAQLLFVLVLLMISYEGPHQVMLTGWSVWHYSLMQTKKTAGWLAGELSREGHQVALLSGEMHVEQRAAVIDRFRDGKEKVLVTTNVCARGEEEKPT